MAPLFLILLPSLSLLGQAPDPTLLDIENQAVAEASKRLPEETLVEKTSTSASTAPDPYAQSLHATYQEFFSLLSFAINSVEPTEDGQALAVRLNPLRRGSVQIGATVTATKPAIYDPLAAALPADSRGSISSELEKQLNDLDDLLFSASLSLGGECDLQTEKACFGKSPASYSSSLSNLLSKQTGPTIKWGTPEDAEAYDRLTTQYAKVLLSLGLQTGAKISTIKDANAKARVVAMAKDLGTLKARAELAFDLETYAQLLDNQPQFAGTFSYHSRRQLSGPDESAASLEFQVGAFVSNINTLKAKRARNPEAGISALISELKGTAAANRLVVTANYKRRSGYSLDVVTVPEAQSNGTKPPPVKSYAVNLTEPSSDEFSVKAQLGVAFGLGGGTRLLMAGKREARLDVSLEGLLTHKDAIREKNRWVATGTLTVPVGESLQIPVSVTWANKAEYLVDQKRQVGAHVGVSYRLPWNP